MAYKDNVQPRMEGLVQQQNKRTSRDCTCLSAYREYREYSVAAAVNAAETSGLRLLGNFRSAHACASMCALGCAQYSGRRSPHYSHCPVCPQYSHRHERRREWCVGLGSQEERQRVPTVLAVPTGLDLAVLAVLAVLAEAAPFSRCG